MKPFLLFGLVLTLAGCVREKTSPQDVRVPAVYTATSGDTLYVDTKQSVIRWRGTKFWGLGKHEGIIRLASGHLYVYEDAITGGSFVIDMNTIEITDIPKSEPVPRKRLRNHLMHDDFFAVATYPTAVFTLTEVASQQDHVYRVTGDLTLRGRTHPVTFAANIPVLSERAVRAEAQFSIDRQQWGVAYRGSRLTNDLVDDEIYLDLYLDARHRAY